MKHWQRFAIAMLAVVCLFSSIAAMAVEENVFPIGDGSTKLSLYLPMWEGNNVLYSSLMEHPSLQKYCEITGIELELVEPPMGDDGTFFNMVITSGEYPDIFYAGDMMTYPGGADGAIEDGIILNHNELVEQYASNYLSIYNSASQADQRKMRTAAGVYKFVKIGSNVIEGIMNSGLVMRQDFLDAVGMSAPKTIDELTAALRAFKTELNVEVPLALPSITDTMVTSCDSLAGAFGATTNKFMLDENGNVTHGYLQEGYADFLALLQTWMSEGLIDIDSINRTASDCLKMTYTGISGAAFAGCFQVMEMLTLGQSENPEYNIVGVNTMRLEDPDQQLTLCGVNHTFSGGAGNFWISTTCEDPIAAIRFIDGLYNEDINLLFTFGVGELEDGNWTYVEENGERQYSDYIMNNPDIPYGTMRFVAYLQQLTSRTLDSLEMQQYGYDLCQQCWDAWSYHVDDSRLIPASVTLTAEENAERNEIMTDLDIYMLEGAYNIICGDEPVEKWAEYVATAKDLGIDRAVEITQAAYDRYLNG